MSFPMLTSWDEQVTADGLAARRDVYAKVAPPMTANPDAPIDQGGLPFWARILQSGMPTQAAAIKTTDKTATVAGTAVRSTWDSVKASVSAAGTATGNVVSGLSTKLIVIMVLVIVGMLVFNRVLARAGA